MYVRDAAAARKKCSASERSPADVGVGKTCCSRGKVARTSQPTGAVSATCTLSAREPPGTPWSIVLLLQQPREPVCGKPYAWHAHVGPLGRTQEQAKSAKSKHRPGLVVWHAQRFGLARPIRGVPRSSTNRLAQVRGGGQWAFLMDEHAFPRVNRSPVSSCLCRAKRGTGRAS